MVAVERGRGLAEGQIERNSLRRHGDAITNAVRGAERGMARERDRRRRGHRATNVAS